MTDEAKALVERLRWGAWYYEDPFDGKAYASDDPLEAADLIETQAREIERLREALQSVINACDQGKLAPLGGPCGMTIEAQIRGSVYNRVPAWPVEEARAALAGDSHDQ